MIGLDVVAKVTLLVASGLLASLMLRRRSAAVRHWILASTLAAALLTPVLARLAPEWRLPAMARPAAIAVDQDAGDDFTVVGVRGEPTAAPAFAPSAARGAASGGRLLFWLAALWLSGVATMFMVIAAGLGRLWWLARHADVVRDGAWHEVLTTLTSELGVRPVSLLQSDHPTLLVTWGVMHPRVFLPAVAREWSETRIRLVLRHELAHIRRGDWVSQLVAEAVKAFHWYNPLVWMACRRLRTESELACDAELMNEGLSGPDYATELLELARTLNAPRASWTAALAMARPSSLEGRVTAMLTERLNREPMEKKKRALAVAAAIAVATGLAGLNGFAQSFSTLSGSVLDQRGGIIPRGMISLTSKDNERKYEVKADGSGQYQFVGVVPGDYVLSAQIPGFKDGSTNLTIAASTVRRDLLLPVGALEETITVVHRAGSDGFVPAGRPVQAAVAPKATSCDDTVPSGRIKPPTKIKDVRPVYPENLAATSSGGVVALDALIGPDGAVQEATAKDPSVNPDLAAAAIAAVRQWRFTPTLLNCIPVEVEMTVRVNFRAE